MTRLVPQRLITVSSPDFLLATRVMLHSFLASNSWFTGEIVVLHSRLGDAAIAQLQQAFPRLVCRPVRSSLDAAIGRLVAAHPHLAGRKDRFLSLEALLMAVDAPGLFIDSDVVVCGDLGGLGDLAAPLVACPDATMLRGLERDVQTLAEVEPVNGQPALASFNAGLMLIDRTAADDPAIERMFALLTPESWCNVASQHTDQAVWNQLLRDRVALAPVEFNFLVGHSRLYRDERMPDPDAIRMFHFNGADKPWLPDRFADVVARGGIRSDAFQRWRAVCRDMLAGTRP